MTIRRLLSDRPGAGLRRWGLLAACLWCSALGFHAPQLQAQRLSIVKTSVDVGRTGYEIPVTATFELRNRGIRRLKIQEVRPDCDCTTVEYPKGEIGIGDKFTIKMTYDARMLGHFNKQAAIISNGTKKPVYLTMTGVVLAELQDYSGFYPYDFSGGLLANMNELEFDNVNKGEHPQQVVRIMNDGNELLQPNVQHLPPYLDAVVTPEQLSPGHSGTITFTLNSDRLNDYGLTQTSVYLAKQLGENVKSETEIGVSTVLVPDVRNLDLDQAPELALSDSTLTFQFDGRTKKKTGEIILYNPGHAELTISSLQMFTPGLKVTLGKSRLMPGETTKLKVTAYAEQLQKVRTQPRVLMISNSPQNPKVVIKVNVEE